MKRTKTEGLPGNRAGRVAVTVLVTLSILVLAGGCVRKYVRSDIASYAKKLTGRSSLRVSEGYQEIQEDEEGYLDHLWTVTDEESGIVFHVLDDYYWALEEVENQLLNDYDSSVFLALLEQKKLPVENGLSLKRTDQSGLVYAELTCSFTDMESLRACYEELESVRQALEREGYPGLRVTYTVRYSHPVRRFVDYQDDEGDTTGEIGSLDEDAYALMRRNYLACALDYRFGDALAEFSEQEILDLVHAEDTVRIYRKDGALPGSGPAGLPASAEKGENPDDKTGSGQGEDGTDSETGEKTEDGQAAASADRVIPDTSYYEGVTGSPRYAGISFGTLYELARIEGFEPEGDPWHFSFTAPDGAKLEFSYDFHDLSGYNDRQGKLKKGYYYIRDDRKMRMSSYYANHFEASEINALTGLQLAEDRPYVTARQEEGEQQKSRP